MVADIIHLKVTDLTQSHFMMAMTNEDKIWYVIFSNFESDEDLIMKDFSHLQEAEVTV